MIHEYIDIIQCIISKIIGIKLDQHAWTTVNVSTVYTKGRQNINISFKYMIILFFISSEPDITYRLTEIKRLVNNGQRLIIYLYIGSMSHQNIEVIENEILLLCHFKLHL